MAWLAWKMVWWLQLRSPPQLLGVRTSAYLSQGDRIQPPVTAETMTDTPVKETNKIISHMP